ncbi:MAG: PadR family transcriptional regulator [Solirubrobacterales bacterium]
MTARPAKKASGRAMSSQVYWALLGVVIERPSYGLELYNRFQRMYGDVLPISGESHVYSALNVLEGRGFIATIPEVGVTRQPKPHYQATQLGEHSYVEWLVEQVDAERRRQELWVRQLTIFAHNPRAAVHVLGRFEREYLKGTGQVGHQPAGEVAGARDELIDGLVADHQRRSVRATLLWLRHAHDVFEARAAGSAARDDPPRA